jgi:hypothetical protein
MLYFGFFPLCHSVVFKWHFCTLISIYFSIIIYARRWIERTDKREREKKKYALYTMRPYETHRRKSLTLVVTDGCWPPLLLQTNIYIWTNARACIMYKTYRTSTKKESMCMYVCVLMRLHRIRLTLVKEKAKEKRKKK